MDIFSVEFVIYFFFSSLGILISIFLPGLRKLVVKYRQTAGPAAAESTGSAIWNAIKPHLAIGIFSLITALILLAALGDTITNWSVALLLGYAWESTLDSTLQKLAKS
jgi:hypothetical protein